MDKIGRRIKELRLEQNLSMQQLANKTNLSMRGIQNYELNLREPKISALIALADFFDVSLDYLVGRSDIKK